MIHSLSALMGLCQSEEERRQRYHSYQIDKELREAHELERRIVKLLLLGAGECGKTTLIKQMRILHSNGFSLSELMQHRPVVYSNTVKAMAEMLRGMRALKLTFRDPQREEDARVVMQTLELGEESQPFSAALTLALWRLWADPGLNTATYLRRLEFNPHESAKHFFDSLARICDPTYCPTYDDILHTRNRTTGIVEVNFLIKGVQLRVFDVGGQRSERKKWIHCFEGVNSIIFVSAVSEYDQVLNEDESTNRLIESMRLFEAICNSRWFLPTSIILFLNKKDLFEEKVCSISIRTCFREYTGPPTYEDSIAYIRGKFTKLNSNPKKTVYVHQTTCTDTNQVHLILDSVISIIFQANLHKTAVQ